MKRLLFFPLLSLLSGFLCSCDGIFHNIYDDPKQIPQSEYGFIKVDEKTCSGIIYVDASTYDRWVYIDFRNKRIDTTNILVGENEPVQWDFALHRYDVKTNNGSAVETAFSLLEDVPPSDNINLGEFSPDISDSIMVDVSGMMDGIIKYVPSKKNPVLSRWMNVDTGTMPPIYTLSNKVYILQMSNGSRAALLFTNYMSPASVKGIITIHYIYPY